MTQKPPLKPGPKRIFAPIEATPAEIEQDETANEDLEAGALPLKVTQQEIYCQFIIKGLPHMAAYVAAGYSEKSPSNAYRISAREDVQQRIQWLLKRSARVAAVDAGYVRQKLKRIVELGLAVDIDKKGIEQKTPTFNMQAATRALELLGKEIGMFKERIELGGHVQVANTELLKRLLPAERQFLREMLRTAAQRMPEAANQNAGEIEETPAAGVTGE